MNKEKASPDLQVSGCTTVIQSGKETKKNLSIAFNNRGNGYRAKNYNDTALADYNQAIRLDPNNPPPLTAAATSTRTIRITTAPSPNTTRRSSFSRNTPRPTTAATSTKAKDYDRAIAEYNEAIRLDPKYASPYNGRGAYKQEGLRPRHRRIQPGDPPRSGLCTRL